MSSRRRLGWLSAAAIAAVAFQAVTIYVNNWPGSHTPGVIYVVSTLAPGAFYLAAGLLALHRRPTERLGWLFLFVGFAWYLPAISNLRFSLPFTIQFLVPTIYQPCLGYLALAWPSGRLRSRFQRVVVIVIFLQNLGGNAVEALFWSPRSNGCSASCPSNLLLVDDSARVEHLATNIVGVTGVITLLVVALLVHNWRSAQGYARRELTPVLWVAAPVVAFVLTQNVVNSFNLTVSEVLFDGVGPLVYLLPPLAYLWWLAKVSVARRSIGTALVRRSATLRCSSPFASPEGRTAIRTVKRWTSRPPLPGGGSWSSRTSPPPSSSTSACVMSRSFSRTLSELRGWRSSTRDFRPRLGHSSSRCAPRGLASWRPATMRGVAWNVTSTTAPNSAS
jgi:hypothetical protein